MTQLETVVSTIGKLRQTGPKEFQGQCPAHASQGGNSLCVSEGDGGKVLVHCFGGCEPQAIMSSVGMSLSDLFPDDGRSKNASTGDIVADVCRLKRMPLESALAFGAKADYRGNLEVCRFPMYSELREKCSSFDISDISPEFQKGLSAKGQPTGVFVAEWPQPGDVVLITEGVKDAAALNGLGFKAVGLPTCKLARKFARVFAGCHCIIVPDRDTTGESAAEVTASRLAGVAASVRIATLPTELKSKGGDGVREVLAAKDGETMLRQAIADARTWKPEQEDGPPDEANEWTSLRFVQGLTDRANSRRFLKAYGDRVRFVHSWNKWLVWTGTHWKIDDGGAVLRLAMAIADQVWMDSKNFLTKEVVDFAVATSGHGKLQSMLKLAAADVPVSVDELDRNPWLLNCENGTLDLRTGQLREHRREDLITKLCPTKFDSNAKADNWLRFLDGVFGGRQETIDFVQRVLGYCLTGDISEQILLVLWGSGSNGKSTLLTAFQDVLGPHFSMAAPAGLLTVQKSDRHPTELADLFGMRFVVSQETEDGSRLAESLVKSLTGGDKIRARRMKENFWEFDPTHKFALCTNHKPEVRGDDHGIWRRLVLVPFRQKFWNPAKNETGPDHLRQDKTLPAKLKAESEGILAWAVRGCLDWQRGGLRIPSEVQTSTDEYRTENNVFGRFLNAFCVIGTAYKTKFSDIYNALETFCDDSGDALPPKRALGAWLKEHDFKEHNNNGRWYLGIALNPDFNTYQIPFTE